MKTNASVESALKTDYALYAVPKLVADWNLNRYFSPIAKNILPEEDYGFDTEAFPISSIVEPNRPSGGIHKARIGHSVITDGYGSEITPRFYLSASDDVYKYWTSPEPTDGSGNFRLHTDGKSIVRPYVTYDKAVKSNKIVIKMNIGWAEPNSFNITLGTGGVWRSTPIATSPNVSNDGTITLYYNGTSWSSNKPSDQTPYDTFDSIMLTVNSLKGGRRRDGTPMSYYETQNGVLQSFLTTGKNTYFDLIAIEAHFEADLSDRLISVQDTFDMSEVSTLYPMGTVTTNVGNIVLSNETGIFNTQSPTSPYQDMLEPNVEFNLSYIYTIGGAPVEIQQFRMYGGIWQGQRTETVSIDLEDHSKFLQTTFPKPALWENLSVNQIIWRLLDSVGFVNFNITFDDLVTDHIIPAYFVTGEKSVWEELGELAVATQTAIYFDCWNRLQTQTRNSAFNHYKPVSWNFSNEDRTGQLADIVSFNQEEELGTNKVIIRYQNTKWNRTSSGIPMLERVWEPEGTITLRASQLVKTLDKTDTMAFVSKDDIKIWPWKGLLQVGGEIMEFEGKQYVYYDASNDRHTVIVKSADEKEKKDKLTPGNRRWQNHFTGGLAITERGKWDSEIRTHKVDIENYSTRSVINGTSNSNAGGLHHVPAESAVQLYGGGKFKDYNDLLVATIGSTADTGFFTYGTRFKFEDGNGYKGRRAGLVIHNDSNEDGYFIDVISTFELNGKERDVRNEVVVYTKKAGKYKSISSNGGKGGTAAIQDNVWYDLDVFFKVSGNDHILYIYLDGRKVEKLVISGADKVSPNGRFGMFIRGDTKATFEYLYAIKDVDDDDTILEPEDDLSWFDMIRTGYNGGLWDREWVYATKTYWSGSGKDKKKRKKRLNQRFFDDFGPYLHEIREYDVKFDPAPVESSRLFSTNDWGAIALEYTGTPFGGHFILCNTSRRNSVLNGEDNLSFRQQSSGVNQVLAVYGHALNFADETTYECTNEAGIQKRGKVEVELNSPWIQSEAMAKEIGEWMMFHWGEGVENVTLEVFGNPLVEVGDVVNVEYTTKDLNDKFFITGINNTFDTGIKTVLTLRRVRIF